MITEFGVVHFAAGGHRKVAHEFKSLGNHVPRQKPSTSRQGVSRIQLGLLFGNRKRHEVFAQDRVRHAHHGCLANLRDLADDLFDLGWTDTEPGGFYLGNSARDRQWTTRDGKALFKVCAIPDLALPAGQLRLTTVRSHDQYNTTIYDLNDRYRGIYGTRNVLMMNQGDIEARGLLSGDAVDITSHYDDGKARIVRHFRVTAYDMPSGCAAGYFPELNPLVCVDRYAAGSYTPASKFIPITIAKSK